MNFKRYVNKTSAICLQHYLLYDILGYWFVILRDMPLITLVLLEPVFFWHL